MPKRVEKEKLAGKGTISQAEQIQVRLVKTAERLDTENMIVGPKEEAKRDELFAFICTSAYANVAETLQFQNPS